MPKFFFLLFLSICTTLAAQTAQTSPYSIFGHVEDAFIHHYLDSVNISILNTDSLEINSTYSYANSGLNFRLLAKQTGPCILRFVKKGYETLYLPMKLKFSRYRMTQINLGNIGMKKVLTKQLKEAVVKATRIKMVMHGDTTVYDALAFKMVQGSMLDALIRMLPGVELSDNGQIKVNGRAVSSLLVNGENFFRGDPGVALENLPAYMVSNVKVYEEISETNRALGLKQHGQKPLVMNVNLKKEYSIGWLANIQEALGSKKRYDTHELAMRFSPHSRIYLFASMNNINDTKHPDEKGEWNSQEANPDGIKAIKKGGASLVIRDRLNRFYVESNLIGELDNEDNRSTTSTTRFLSGTNIYTRTQDEQHNKSKRLCWNNQLTLTPQWTHSAAYIRITPSIEYRTYNQTSTHRFATFSINPAESYRGAALDSLYVVSALIGNSEWINREQLLSQGNGHSFHTTIEANGNIRFNRQLEDIIHISGAINYREQSDNTHQLADLHYRQTPTSDDLRRQYIRQPLRFFNISGNLIYDYKFTFLSNHISISPYYNYHQEYHHSDRPLYRLEHLGGAWAITNRPVDALPSTNDSLTRAIDTNNSFYSAEHNRRQQTGLSFLLYRNATVGYSDDLNVSLQLPVTFHHQQLKYRRAKLDTLVMRHFTFFEPTLSIDKKLFEDEGQNHQRNLEFSYQLNVISPSLTSLLPIRDNVSPLFVTESNNHIRNSRTHLLSVCYRATSHPCNGYLRIGLNYRLTQGAFCQSIIYNRSSGITTYQQENINGNWKLHSYFYLTRTLDKKKRVTFSTNIGADYINSVDRTLSTESEINSRSTVHTTQISEQTSLSYRFFSLSSQIRSTFANSRRDGFTPIHCADLIHRLSASVPLPLHLQLATDLTLYNRLGYEDVTMNSNQWFWNAQFSYSLMKNNLHVALQAYDILNQLSNITHTLNAQGRVETWHNTIPGYIMLQLIYRLQVLPRQKK